MLVAAILGSAVLSLHPGIGRLPVAALLILPQSAQTPQAPDASTTPSSAKLPRTAPSPPCPATAGDAKSANPDCKPPVHSKRKPKKPTQNVASTGPSNGPTKTVVRNGSTTEPTVEISPGVSQQQMSQQAQTTDQLLASTSANLKMISERQLSAAQQDTVNQIKSFMEQAKTASRNGDVQRAYNLANKANLLSADLKGH